MILIREFDIEEDTQVFTGRDTVLPVNDINKVQKWADSHIPDWTNIEIFSIQPIGIVFEER